MSGEADRQTAEPLPSGKARSLANLTGGSRKGKPNKTTVAVKAALTEAFEKIGGVKALVAWGKSDPGEFYKLWAKMLPQEHTGEDGSPIAHRIELVPVSPK